MKNMIELYFDNGKVVPFIVRRQWWNKDYAYLVTKVKPRKYDSGWYGKVYGYPLPPLNGKRALDGFGITGTENEISCAGCYQWVKVDDIPDEWKKFLQPGGEK